MGALAVDAGSQVAGTSLRLRIGALTLDVRTPESTIARELEGRFGDCMVPASGASDLQCVATLPEGGSFLSLEFSGAMLPDPFDSALTPFLMLRHLRGEIVEGRPFPGWRALVREGDGEVLLAGDRTRLLVCRDGPTRELATDCLLGVPMAAQPDILFLHGASFAIGGRGGLLIGPGKSGKSSTVLALAARGHSFLGDDLAAVRMASGEVLPFPKSAGLRQGRIAREIEARARGFRAMPATGLDGVPRKYARVSDMFPQSRPEVHRLHAVFILEGFAPAAHVTRYQPGMNDARKLRAVVSESVPGWAGSAGLDLLRFLRVSHLLSGLRCYLLMLGSLEESASLIEREMAIQ